MRPPEQTVPQLDGIVQAPDLAQTFRSVGCGAMGMVTLLGITMPLTIT